MRRSSSSCAPGRAPRGLTVIETLLAITVLEVAVLAVSFAVVAGRDRAVAADGAMRGVDVAEHLLEHVLAVPYQDPDGASTLGPEIGETGIDAFDNADDFHGYTDQVGDPPGTPGGHRFTRTVMMTVGTETVTGLDVPISGLVVTVTTVDDAARSWSITRFIPEIMP